MFDVDFGIVGVKFRECFILAGKFIILELNVVWVGGVVIVKENTPLTHSMDHPLCHLRGANWRT